MGCTSSSNKREEKSVVEDNHVSELTRKQRFLLKSSWKGVSRELEKTSENLSKLIQKNNECGDVLRHLSEDQISLMVEQILDRIDLVVFHLEEEQTVIELIQNTSTDMRSQYNIPSSFFANIPEPFLTTIELILDARFTSQMQTIYTKFIEFIVSTMVK